MTMGMKKSIIKKIMCIAVSAAAVISTLPGAVYAYDLPHAFWALNNSYDAAIDSGNNADIIKYGSEIVDLISGEPENDDTVNIIGSRAYEVAFAAYYMKDYDTALKYFKLYIPYGEKCGWADGVKIAKEFVLHLTNSLELYKFTDKEQWNFGVKNEPHGVLMGEVAETTRGDDSMILLYLEYGDTYFDWINQVFKNAAAKGQTIELALNFPNEGDTARSVNADDPYLKSLWDMVSSHKDVPVLLRIGAEVNIWKNACTPDEFKSAFRTISGVMRDLPNVAVVWSVAHTADWTRKSSDFYPGDEYVDWVGVTAYPTKYFSGKHWEGKSVFNEVVFKTGYAADPVIEVKEIIDEFGGRKPIMISECGAAYETGGEINERYDDWGAKQLRDMYALIPMVYPQVKLMAYFNTRVPNELNYYDYKNSDPLKAAYTEMSAMPWFIHGKSTDSAQTFFEHVDGTMNAAGTVTVGAYPHLYGSDTIKVDYYIDGTWAAQANSAPYKAELNIPAGSHTLKVVAEGNNGATMEKTYTVTGDGSAPSQSAPQGGTGTTDQPGTQGGGDPKNPAQVDELGFTDTAPLSDVQKAAVKNAVDNGIVTGYEDKTFRPENTITRAEFAAMICRMMNYDTSGKCSFTDAADHWATGYIQACVEAGQISGVGDNKFAPDDKVTLEQAVKIITIARGMAESTAVYPDGFLKAAEDNGIMENLTSTVTDAPLNRIDAAMLITQSAR